MVLNRAMPLGRVKQVFFFITLSLIVTSCIERSNNSGNLLMERVYSEMRVGLFEPWNFHIEFPMGVLKVDSLSVDNQTTFSLKSNGALYGVKCFDDPDNYYHSDTLDAIVFNLEYTQRKFMQENAILPSVSMPKSIQGYPGRAFQYAYNNSNKVLRREVYMVKNRIYEISYEGPPNSIYLIPVDNFFESFRLKDVEENEIPYLNLPSAQELKDPPYTANFFGETIQNIEIVETVGGQGPLILDANEIDNKDGSGLLLLGVSYVIFPEDAIDMGIEYYVKNSIESMKALDPEMVVLTKEIQKKSADVSVTRMLGEHKCIHNLRYILTEKHFFSVMSISLHGIPQDERIESFFKSFRLK